MRYEKMIEFIFISSCFVFAVFAGSGLAAAAGTFGPQSSNKYQEWGFDFVETFDGLQDWRGTKSAAVSDQSDMPKLSNGSPSAWGWYSYWGTMPTGHTWIGNHGPDKVWGGTGKSLCMDLDDEVQGKGPSRLGLYFGDGSPTSGYEEIYIFYMVKIQKNQWPTSISDSKVGSYSESSFPNYEYFASWKFGTMNMGMSGPHEYGGSSTTYSPFHIIPHIKPSGGKLKLNLEPYGIDNFWGDYAINDYIGDQWFGVEFHLRNSGSTTYMDVWLYDPQGNAHATISNVQTDSWASVQSSSHQWNDFFFGGNNSDTYLWGPTMESPYYVDDLIIDDQRIGPKYFEIQTGIVPDEVPPSAPANLRLK